MDLYLTFDHELFFGNPTGSIESCMITPGNRLLDIFDKHQVKSTWFIDASFLYKLKTLKLTEQYLAFKKHILDIENLGHRIQLHIHPHWKTSTYNNVTEKWQIDLSRYRANQFDNIEFEIYFKECVETINEIIKNPVNAYRAGGWSIQPFEDFFYKPFSENLIKIDSSVYKGGKILGDTNSFDFSNAPDQEEWFFENDILVNTKFGQFKEMPISTSSYHPLFFWQLYILGRLFPKNHKSMGKGISAGSGMSKFNLLTKVQRLPLSLDGYFMREVPSKLKLMQKNNYKQAVLIGHPKAATNYSINKMDTFLRKYKNMYQFKKME